MVADVMPYLDQAAYTGAVDDKKDTPLRCPTNQSARVWPFIDYGLNAYVLPSGQSDIPIMNTRFQFRHGNAANVVMFDGHVEKVTKQQLADPQADKRMKGEAE